MSSIVYQVQNILNEYAQNEFYDILKKGHNDFEKYCRLLHQRNCSEEKRFYQKYTDLYGVGCHAYVYNQNPFIKLCHKRCNTDETSNVYTKKNDIQVFYHQMTCR